MSGNMRDSGGLTCYKRYALSSLWCSHGYAADDSYRIGGVFYNTGSIGRLIIKKMEGRITLQKEYEWW